MPSVPYTYLTDGNIGGALNWVMTDYIGYGMLWMFMGILLAALIFSKTRSFGITGIVFIFYTIAVTSVLPVEMQPYFLLMIGIMLSILGVKIWLGR